MAFSRFYQNYFMIKYSDNLCPFDSACLDLIYIQNLRVGIQIKTWLWCCTPIKISQNFTTTRYKVYSGMMI
jgi:hypothetical protein